MKNTFLYQLWRHNPKLCYLLITFATLTLAANVAGDEVTPFFVWGMYSEKEKPVEQYELLRTTINDSTVVNMYDHANTDTRFYLSAPLAYYKRIKDNNHQDPTITFLQTKLQQHYAQIRFLESSLFNTQPQQQAFLYWYARYLHQATGQPVNSIRIDVVKAHYTDNKLVTDSVYLFEKWEKP
ncbi:hypothetical protein [Longitalea luteola]|uniref:hypothetical protein n=1 Tax=Longitalea luteola TaxID=2812563 RepID=UPI001A95F555|nr:hypothetical protein [Longitalea luteola]